jgi:hypothetical protein
MARSDLFLYKQTSKKKQKRRDLQLQGGGSSSSSSQNGIGKLYQDPSTQPLPAIEQTHRLQSRIKGKKKRRGVFEPIGKTPYRARDPRFEGLSGDFAESTFEQTFGSVVNEVREGERDALKKKLGKTKSEQSRQRLRDEYSRVNQAIVEGERRKRQKEKERALRKRTQGQEGKHFVKRSEIRRIRQEDKEDEWKRTGKWQKVKERKERKQQLKDTHFMKNAKRKNRAMERSYYGPQP